MKQYGAFRFGWDSPSRIATSTVVLDEALALLPGEPMYQHAIPFYPEIVSGSSAGVSTSTDTSWEKYPGRVDLTWYQGDDVMIPLYFDNPEDTDMSDQDGFTWHAEVRVCHTYRSTLINTFSVDSEAIPAFQDIPAMTKVTMFLPRSENIYVGVYRWDLYSVSPLIPADMDEFPRPPDVPEPEPWPPTTTLRTWLYGKATILPRVTETDFLPSPTTTYLGESYSNFDGLLPFTATKFVGPNGQVP